MRTMTYRIELNHENGYVISNADVSWEALPGQQNISQPSIRVSNAPLTTGQIIANIDDYVELDDDSEIDTSFQKNYLKALHGEIDDWLLIAVRIQQVGVTLFFANKFTGTSEYLYIWSAPYLRVWFDICNAADIVERYLLEISEDENGKCRLLRVTEYDNRKKREIIFNRSVSSDARCPDEQWEYAYVTEYYY